jgi:hypothetical protein
MKGLSISEKGSHLPIELNGRAASWTAAALGRFWNVNLHRESARGLAHSKTLRHFGLSLEKVRSRCMVAINTSRFERIW